MLTRRKAAALTIAAVSILTLAGCSTPQTDPAPSTPAAQSEFSPADAAGIPHWKTGSLPSGWTQDEIPVTDIPNVSKEDAQQILALNPPTAFNADRTCYIQVQTTFLQAHHANRGAAYLSKYALYQQADMAQATTRDEKVIKFQSDQGPLDAYSGIVNRDASMFNSPAQGAAPTSSVGTWMAERTFDKVTDNPMVAISVKARQAKASASPEAQSTPAGTPSADDLKGVPVAGMTVACKTAEQFKALDLAQLVDSFTLITK